ncbi:Uncharacterized protein Fot_23822 [Forsythia ovata]|uniref:Uncharacterized protein n=1 Tax=Forsythia ovata TaxID=205694 RepID=A0ABD1U4F8_9LAMI
MNFVDCSADNPKISELVHCCDCNSEGADAAERIAAKVQERFGESIDGSCTKPGGKKNWMDLTLLEFVRIELIEENKSVRVEELAEGNAIAFKTRKIFMVD